MNDTPTRDIDIQMIDVLHDYPRCIGALGILIQDSEDTLAEVKGAGWMLEREANTAKTILDGWWAQKKQTKPSAKALHLIADGGRNSYERRHHQT